MNKFLFLFLFCFISKTLLAAVAYNEVASELPPESRQSFNFQFSYGRGSMGNLLGDRDYFDESELKIKEDPQYLGGSFYSSLNGSSNFGFQGSAHYFWITQGNKFYYNSENDSRSTDNTGGKNSGKRKIQAGELTFGLRYEMNVEPGAGLIPYISGGFGLGTVRDIITRGDGAKGPSAIKSGKFWEKPLGYIEGGLEFNFLGNFDSTSQAKQGFFGHLNNENAGIVIKAAYQADFQGGAYDMSGIFYSIGLSVRTDS